MFESKLSIFSDTKKVISAKAGLQSPLHIVQFANANVKHKEGKCLQYQSFKSSELNLLFRPKRIIVATNQKLEYAGSNYESEMSKITSSLLKVGIYNKRSRNMKLYDVDFYHLRPVVKFYNVDNKETEKTWKEKTEDLALAFGSKNRQKMISSRLKFESTANNQIVTPISTKFIEAEMVKTQVVETTRESEVIPPQNKTATSVDKVYNLFDIISEGEYHMLDSSADTFIDVNREDLHTWKMDKKYCGFITHILEINFQNLTLHKAKILCYLHYMMCLMQKSNKDFKKKDPAPEIPEPFKKKLMEKYLVNRNMPPRMKDKCLAHATVLALTVNNYNIDCGLWALSTQIPIKRLVLVAYALGCHVSERKKQDTKLIELKLPLYKYEPMKRQKK